MRSTLQQRVVPRDSTRLRRLQAPEEWGGAEAWRNLAGFAVIAYGLVGILTFAFCRDGADLGWLERIVHPVHALLRWAILALFG